MKRFKRLGNLLAKNLMFKWLPQVTVGAEFKRFNGRVEITVRRHDKNRHPRCEISQPWKDIESVFLAQSKIEQNQRKVFTPRRFERRGPRGTRKYRVSLFF